MKRFLQLTLEFKTHVCIVFTASLFIYTAIYWLSGWAQGMHFSTMAQFLALSVLAVAYQWTAFSHYLFKQLRYAWRVVLFAGLFLPTLALFAYFARWFPAQDLKAWLFFAGIFLIIFVLASIGFEVCFRIQGYRYDQLLGQHRGQQNKPE